MIKITEYKLYKTETVMQSTIVVVVNTKLGLQRLGLLHTNILKKVTINCNVASILDAMITHV